MTGSTDPRDQVVPAHFHRGAPQDAHQARRHRAILGAMKGLSGAVLDYGCGWGDITCAISRTHPDVRGVDVDPQRVAFAAAQYPEIAFSVCAAQGLEFADASFDVVTSVVVLPFVPDPGAYLDEVRRVLRPGGHFVFSTQVMDWTQRLSRRLRGPARMWDDPAVRPSGTLWTPPARIVENLLGQHGFRILERSAFFDPPMSNRKNLGDLVGGVIALAGEAVGSLELAPYRVYRLAC